MSRELLLQGGWSFLDPDSDEENQEEVDDEDSEDDGAYAPSDEELGSEEESEDYSGESEISDSEYSEGNMLVCTEAEYWPGDLCSFYKLKSPELPEHYIFKYSKSVLIWLSKLKCLYCSFNDFHCKTACNFTFIIYLCPPKLPECFYEKYSSSVFISAL